jgi:hypothetical protein
MSRMELQEGEDKRIRPIFMDTIARLTEHVFTVPDGVTLIIDQMFGPVAMPSGVFIEASSRFLTVHAEGITVENALADMVNEVQEDLNGIAQRFPELKYYIYAPYTITWCDSVEGFSRYFLRVGKWAGTELKSDPPRPSNLPL